MSVRAGECPVCLGAGDLVFVIAAQSGRVFVYCDPCGTAWDHVPTQVDSISSPETLAPEGHRLATRADVVAAGFILGD